MNKRFAVIPLFLLLIFSLFFVSCGEQPQQQTDTSKLEKQIADLTKRVDDLTKKVEALLADKAIKPVEKLKAGFVYVGPVGDYGWSHAHDLGRKYAENKLPWLETIIVEYIGKRSGDYAFDAEIQQCPGRMFTR